MPSMAAATVKKFDGTTDIIYSVKNPAGGDGSWAEWRQDAGNANPFAGRPVLSIRTTESGKGVRRVDVKYKYPYVYTDTTTTQPVISPLAITFQNGVWTVPQGIPSTHINEAGAQFTNLMVNAIIRPVLYDQSSFN